MITQGRSNRLPRHSRRLAVVLCAAPFFFTGCQQKRVGGPLPHYAVLRFENLSGDPELEWMGRAIGESLPVSLAGKMDGPVLGSGSISRLSATLGPRPISAPGESSERSEALAAGASRLISGYVERTAGQIRISASEEDAATGRTLRTITASGPSPAVALDKLSHAFSPNPQPGPAANVEALRAYAIAFEAPSPKKEAALVRAVQLDPDFGEAWVALVGAALGRGDRAAAEDVIARAKRRKLDALSSASLDIAEANLKGDRPAAIAAMRRVADLSPADLLFRRGLAENETAAGDFQSSAADWKKVTGDLPNDALAWNSLGYARAYAGDYAGSLAALREYERLRPKDANPLDSIGDVNYSFGKYAVAAGNYIEANNKQPGFEDFGDLYKAAWAKFEAGDKAGADALFSQYRAARAKSPGAFFGLIEGDWLYRTGHEQEGIAFLRKLLAGAAPDSIRADAWAQLTIWDLLQGNRAQAAKDAAAVGSKTNSPPVFMARFAALPSADAPEWESRAQRMVPPSLAALRRLAVGYALILDNKRAAAAPVWEEIANSANATDFFPRAVYNKLQGKGPVKPLLPNAGALNQFAAILDKP